MDPNQQSPEQQQASETPTSFEPPVSAPVDQQIPSVDSTVTPPAPSIQPQAVAPSAENPGQTLGIISIVVTVLGFGLVGLILGVLSRNKSKAANMSTTLGTVGLVLGIISTVVGFLVGIFLVIGIIAAANDPSFVNSTTY